MYVEGVITPDEISDLILEQDQGVDQGINFEDAVSAVIRKHLYSFALHGAEKYLKPAIVNEIREKIDGGFESKNLERYMPDSFAAGVHSPPASQGSYQPSSPKGRIMRQLMQLIIEIGGYTVDEIDEQMRIKEELGGDNRFSILIKDVNATFATDIEPEDLTGIETLKDLAEYIARIESAIDTGNNDEVRVEKESDGEPESGNDAVLERVIEIIMNATGYERDEISPEMDIREDLSIKSSRIPIIADGVEKTFNITTSLGDFFTVRTVRDLSDRVTALMGKDHQLDTGPAPANIPAISSSSPVAKAVSNPTKAVNRMVFKSVSLPWPEEKSSNLEPGSRILVLCLGAQKYLNEINDYLTKTYKAEVVALNIGTGNLHGKEVNLFNPEEGRRLGQELLENEPPAGVILLSENVSPKNDSHRLW